MLLGGLYLDRSFQGSTLSITSTTCCLSLLKKEVFLPSAFYIGVGIMFLAGGCTLLLGAEAIRTSDPIVLGLIPVAQGSSPA